MEEAEAKREAETKVELLEDEVGRTKELLQEVEHQVCIFTKLFLATNFFRVNENMLIIIPFSVICSLT